MAKRLRLAIQKKGRLGVLVPPFLERAGLHFEFKDNQLFASCNTFPLDLLFIRHRDILPFLEQQQADLGIIGSDVYYEERSKLPILLELGLARSALTLAIPHQTSVSTIKQLKNKTIATTFPTLTKQYFAKHNIPVTVVTVSGSVEVTTKLGIADAITDLVGTGSTLKINGLKPLETLLEAQAIVVGQKKFTTPEQALVDKLLVRLQSVKDANTHKYLLFNLPEKNIAKVHTIFPGLSGPSIIKVEAKKPLLAVHLVVKQKDLWEKMHALQQIGATGIVVLPIENLLF